MYLSMYLYYIGYVLHICVIIQLYNDKVPALYALLPITVNIK